MKSVDDVLREASTRFTRGWAQWAAVPDTTSSRQTFTLGAPTPRQIESDVVAADAWIRTWTQFSDMHDSLRHDVDALRDLDWARTAPRVTYWGDIDAQGFAIRSRVRGLGYPALTRSA